MLNLGREAVATALPYTALVDALDEAFRHGIDAPARQHYALPVAGEPDGALLLMPAWQSGRALGIKVATVFPGNAARGLASVNASYLLLDGTTGQPRATLDGSELTLRRTGAASALASRYLSREDARELLVVGTGGLAPHLAAAHAAVRPIDRVLVWGRRPARAAAVCDALELPGATVAVAEDLQAACRSADIISCATLSTEPLLRGSWLRGGQHVDLVGAYTPQMRESDDEVIRRARVFVDTRAGARDEAGDLLQAIEAGAFRLDDIAAELAELAQGKRPGRCSDDELTVFKSVGCALEDLAAALLVAAHHGC